MKTQNTMTNVNKIMTTFLAIILFIFLQSAVLWVSDEAVNNKVGLNANNVPSSKHIL